MLNQLKRQMEKNNYCIHLQRKWVNKPEGHPNIENQCLSYELVGEDSHSIYTIHRILKEFCKRSNGEMKYWIGNPTDIIYSTDLDVEKNEGNKEDICALHSGESETNEK